MCKHWQKRTLFLREQGAPLDNNVCERALKKAILHRKNARFCRTLNGARVGDVFMSLIHTVPSPPLGPSAGRRSPVSKPRSTTLAATGRPLRRPNGLLYVCIVLDNSLEILELIETAHTYVNLEVWTVGETIESNGGIAPLEKHTVPRVG